MPKEKTDQMTFEQALGALESLVEKMERGELTLEESLASFERGIKLTRNCQEALEAAEHKVQILTSDDPDAEPEPYDRDD